MLTAVVPLSRRGWQRRRGRGFLDVAGYGTIWVLVNYFFEFLRRSGSRWSERYGVWSTRGMIKEGVEVVTEGIHVGPFGGLYLSLFERSGY